MHHLHSSTENDQHSEKWSYVCNKWKSKPATNSGPLNVYKRNIKWLRNSQNSKNRIKDKCIQDEMKNCTFEPQIKWYHSTQSKQNITKVDNFIKRNDEWQEKRAIKYKKLQDIRRAEEIQELQQAKATKRSHSRLKQESNTTKEEVIDRGM